MKVKIIKKEGIYVGRRFIIRIASFIIFLMLVGIGTAFRNQTRIQMIEQTIIDSYYKMFFGLADGVSEAKKFFSDKLDSVFEFIGYDEKKLEKEKTR